MTKNKKGFTLIELLVVVLIIGVLTAIALPMYQKAVLKSRFSALMPIAKAMADSNEAYYLEHGQYASNPQDLPVQGQSEYPTGTVLELNPALNYAYVLASNSSLNNNYVIYQKESGNFPGEIHCEALKGDEQANWLCEEALHGRKIGGSLTEGYISYVLNGEGIGITATAAAVLAGVACAEGVPESQCRIIDNADGSRTKKECSNPSDPTTCVYSTYNTDQTTTVCNAKGNAVYDEATGVCAPNKQGIKHSGQNYEDFTVTYDEDGNPISGVSCEKYTAANGCTASGLHWYDKDGNIVKYAYNVCASGAINNEDGMCPGGYTQTYLAEYDPSKGGYYTDEKSGNTLTRTCISGNLWEGACTEFRADVATGSYNVDVNYDEHGNKLTQRSCTVGTISPDGTCTQYSGGIANWDSTYTYDDQGRETSASVRYCRSGVTYEVEGGSCSDYQMEQHRVVTYDPDTGVQTARYNERHECGTWNFEDNTCATYVPNTFLSGLYSTYDPTTGKQTSSTEAACTNYADATDKNSCTSWNVTVTPYVNGTAQTGSAVTTGTCAGADFDSATGTCSNLQS